MAHIKETAKPIEVEEASTEVENIAQHSRGEEDLSQVNADPSELMGREKPKQTLRFGTSLVSQNLIKFYIDKGYFKVGEYRPSEGEDIPVPREGETMVF
jgi:hypothetical protein